MMEAFLVFCGSFFVLISSDRLPLTLQMANMRIMSNSECQNTWGGNVITSHVCVRHLNNDASACSGDSGGPLTCGNVLVGATSWGESRCRTTFPSVYTRISAFRTWIKGITGI